MVKPKVGEVDVGSWPRMLFMIVVLPLLSNPKVSYIFYANLKFQ